MENLSIRPKGDFTWTAEYQQLYILTEHWLSDLQFYKGELKFLNHLFDKYFIMIVHKENLDEIRELASYLSNVSEQCDILIERTTEHLHHLSELIDDPFKYDSNKFRNEHENLENKMAALVKQFREVKTEVFTVSEDVIEKEVKRLNA